MNNTPLPDGVAPSVWEKIFQILSPSLSPELQIQVWSVFVQIELFFSVWGAWITLGLVLVGCGELIILSLRRKQKSIQKLWTLILFFLSKRQMMIPIIFTFAQRDQLLSEQELDKLLEIRALSRSVPLRQDPEKRMKIEREISEILFRFFTKIEKNKNYPSQKTMHRILEDLEFIDEKLVELQKVYNREALFWNQKRNFPLVRPWAFLFQFPSFKFFGQQIL